MPRKNSDKSTYSQNSNLNADTTYESVGPSDIVYETKITSSSKIKSSLMIDAPPPPPLPPALKGSNHVVRNANRDSSDSLADSIDFNQIDADTSMESDSGMEVVEEPTLRPSELVRGNNNRSMSIISGTL